MLGAFWGFESWRLNKATGMPDQMVEFLMILQEGCKSFNLKLDGRCNFCVPSAPPGLPASAPPRLRAS